jgi:hypothetical protein
VSDETTRLAFRYQYMYHRDRSSSDSSICHLVGPSDKGGQNSGEGLSRGNSRRSMPNHDANDALCQTRFSSSFLISEHTSTTIGPSWRETKTMSALLLSRKPLSISWTQSTFFFR